MELERRAQTVPSRSALNPEVSGWLENQELFLCENHAEPDAADRHDESNKQQLGFTSALYQACLSLYGEVYKQCRLGSRCPQESQARISQHLGPFISFSEVLEHRKIDLCLGKAPEVNDLTVKLLYHVGRTLTKGATSLEVFFGRKQSDFLLRQCLQEVATQIEKVHFVLSPGDDGGEIVEDLAAFDDENLTLSADELFNRDMNNHIRGLADLVPTLQRLLCEESQSTGEHHNCTSITTFHVTDSARQYVMQISDKYRNAPTALVERLGEANWQRFVRIRGKKYEVEGLDQDPESEEMRLSFRSAFVPTDFHDSGLGTSITFGHHASRSVASHTSFLSSQSDTRKGRLPVPPTPVEVYDGLPFICSICDQRLTDIRNRTEWKIHVFQDLQPYICTFGGCRDALTTFPTRRLWVEHEFSEHRVDRFLKCHCRQTFTNKETFTHHLNYEHLLQLNHSQLLTQIAAAEIAIQQNIHVQKCPLCLQDGWNSTRQFTTHVGRHLEQIALASLPRDVESDSEANSQRSRSSSPLHTSMRNQVPSVSAESQAGIETAMQRQLGNLTAVDETALSPQALRAQITTFDQRVQQPLRPANEISFPTADLTSYQQTHLYGPAGYPATDHGRWADRSVTQADKSAKDSLDEALPSHRSPSQIYSAMKSTPENMRLERDHDAPHLQHRVQQLLGDVQPHAPFSNGETVLSATEQRHQYDRDSNLYETQECYSEHVELPSHPTASRSTLQGHLQSQGPRLFGEYASDAPYPDQNCVIFTNGRSPQYIDSVAYDESLSQISNAMNTASQFPAYQGQSQPLSEIGHHQYSNSNLELERVPLDLAQPAFAPNHYSRRDRGIAAFRDSNGPFQGSVSPEPLQALSPAYATKVPGSESGAKRRRIMHEQSTAEGASKNPRGSAMRATEAPPAASLPSIIPLTAQRGERSRPRTSQSSREADIPNLGAYRSIISKMYLAEGKTLAEVIRYLRDVHNVAASVKQFKTFLKRENIKKNFDIDDVGIMLSLRKDMQDNHKICKIYWCNKEIPYAKIQSYLRKKKITEAQVLAKAKIPEPIPSYIVVGVPPRNVEASDGTFTYPSPDQPESVFLGPLSTGSLAAERPPDGSRHPRRTACVACRKSKAKCDFSDGEGSSATSCIRCRREHKDCVVRQSRRKKTPPVTRRVGKRRRRLSATPASSSTSGTSSSIDHYPIPESEDASFTNLLGGANFGIDDSP